MGGINDLKFEVSITVKKNDDNDDDDNNKEEFKKDEDDEDEDEIPEAVECQIWLKIPVDINRKQIDIWNDILLKTVAIELDLTKEEIDSDDLEKVYKETISLSLEENFVGLGSWNPSLYVSDDLRFEVRCNFDDDDDEEFDDYAVDVVIESADITLILNKMKNDKLIQKMRDDFWKLHSAVQWKFQDVDNNFRDFDRSSNLQVERDYQELLRITNDKYKTLIIPITDGVFFNRADNKNKYQLRIVRSGDVPLFYEVNIETGSSYVVKRKTIDWVNPDVIQKEEEQKAVRFKIGVTNVDEEKEDESDSMGTDEDFHEDDEHGTLNQLYDDEEVTLSKSPGPNIEEKAIEMQVTNVDNDDVTNFED